MQSNAITSAEAYDFTTKWFDTAARQAWDVVIPRQRPQRILEIGSYEGASACYLIGKLAAHYPIELHCIDPWAATDGDTHHGGPAVEARFDRNTKLAISRAAQPVAFTKYKGFSIPVMAKLLTEGKVGYFDFIYIDGSHMAADVLADATLAFALLKVGGVIAFDDYLGGIEAPAGRNPAAFPKMAVDAFTNIYCQKITIISPLHYQLYVMKTAD